MPGKKKVLFLSHWAKHMGGAEYSLVDILREASRHAEVHLCTTEKGPLTELAQSHLIQVHVIPCTELLEQIKRYSPFKSLIYLLRSLPSYLRYLYYLDCLVKRIGPDCIHANVPKSHITLALLHFSGFHGKTVLHIREIFSRYSAAYLLYAILFTYSPLRIIAISHAVKQALPPNLYCNCVVIHNGITLSAHPLPLPPQPPIRFLYFGRIVPWKGCHYLIEAFHTLLQSVPPDSVRLTLSGPTFYWNKTYRDYLTELLRRYRLSQLVSLDNGSDNPREVYRRHHVCCMMSDREPFGRVAAEAQGCGRPVIAFNNGGLPEVIEHGTTGILVNHCTINAFSAAMRYYVDNRDLIEQMGKAGWKRAAGDFNRTVQIPRIISTILSSEL